VIVIGPLPLPYRAKPLDKLWGRSGDGNNQQNAPAILLRGHGVNARGICEIPLGLLRPVPLYGCDRAIDALVSLLQRGLGFITDSM